MDTKRIFLKDPSIEIPGVNFYEKRPQHRNAGGILFGLTTEGLWFNNTYETIIILKSFNPRACGVFYYHTI